MRYKKMIDGVPLVEVAEFVSNAQNREGVVFVGIGADIHEWYNCINAIFIAEGIVANASWCRKKYVTSPINNRIDLIVEFTKKAKINVEALNNLSTRFGNMYWLSSYTNSLRDNI